MLAYTEMSRACTCMLAYTVGFQSTILRRIKFAPLIICMKKKKKIAQTNSGKFEWAVMERKCFQIEINNGSLR